jgi:hypothetical protein
MLYHLFDRFGALPGACFYDLAIARIAAQQRARDWGRIITIVGGWQSWTVTPDGDMRRTNA